MSESRVRGLWDTASGPARRLTAEKLTEHLIGIRGGRQLDQSLGYPAFGLQSLTLPVDNGSASPSLARLSVPLFGVHTQSVYDRRESRKNELLFRGSHSRSLIMLIAGEI